MNKENDLLTSIFDKAYQDSIIYGAGYIRFKDGVIENVSPLEFEKEMIHIVENMYKGKDE